MCVGWKKSLLVRVETHRFGLSQRKKQRDQLVPGSDVIIFWHFFLPLFFALALVSASAQWSGTRWRRWCPELRCFPRKTPELSPLRSLSLSLALPLSQRKPLCDSSQRTLSEPNTASPAPGGERERESWDGKGMRGGDSTGREARRRPQTKNREELGLPRVQWPRNSFSRCPPPVRFLLVFWGEDF